MVTNIKANNPTLKSWLEISKESDFPIQNLPFGIYSTKELSISFPDTNKWAFNPNQLNPLKNQKSIFEITTDMRDKSWFAIIN